MPYPVYTRRLLGGVDLTRLVSTVPPGVIWIVRDVAAWMGGAGGTTTVNIPSAGIVAILHSDPNVGGGYAHWTGRQAVNAGEELQAFSSPAGGYVLVTGYVLAA